MGLLLASESSPDRTNIRFHGHFHQITWIIVELSELGSCAGGGEGYRYRLSRSLRDRSAVMDAFRSCHLWSVYFCAPTIRFANCIIALLFSSSPNTRSVTYAPERSTFFPATV